MTKHVNKTTANLLVEWCIEKYGPSKYADLRTLNIQIDTKLEFLGFYENQTNSILLNPKMHRSLINWCDTVIHEYMHFQQDMKKYREYRNRYEKHPYEVSCNNRAGRDKFEARLWLLRKLRKPLKYNNYSNKH